MTIRAGMIVFARATVLILALTSTANVPPLALNSAARSPVRTVPDPHAIVAGACESRPFLWDRLVGRVLRCDATSGQWVFIEPSTTPTPPLTAP
jgi:hypothetical protein